MILKELYNLAEKDGLMDQPGFTFQPVHWIIDIDKDGQVLEVIQHSAQDGKKTYTPRLQIPVRLGRTNAPEADLFTDKSDYILAFNQKETEGASKNKIKKNLEKLKECFDLSLAEVTKVAEATNAPAAWAQIKAMENIFRDPESFFRLWPKSEKTTPVLHADGNWYQIHGDWKSNHLFAFKFNGLLTHVAPEVRAWINKNIFSYFTGHGKIRCLVDGEDATPVKKHLPFELAGDTGRLPMISFNLSAFNHYGREGNANAPISTKAAFGISKALDRLQGHAPSDDLERQAVKLNDNTTFLYWSKDGPGASDLSMDLFGREDDGTDLVEIKNRYSQKPKHGKAPAPLSNPDTLFSLTLTREKSRVVIRSFGISTVEETAVHLLKYLEELEIAPMYLGDGDRYRSLVHLRNALFPKTEGGKYKIPPKSDLLDRLFQCALFGNPYPKEILALAIRRIRVEGTNSINRSCFALIKAYLIRNTTLDSKEFTVPLNVDHTSNSYHLGRLFAQLESIQGTALGGINAGIGDRFMGSAMATPALVFPRLIKLASHHLKKIREKNERDYDNLNEELLRIFEKLEGSAFPKHQSLDEQGIFALGYYHQRAFQFNSNKKSEEKQENQDAQ